MSWNSVNIVLDMVLSFVMDWLMVTSWLENMWLNIHVLLIGVNHWHVSTMVDVWRVIVDLLMVANSVVITSPVVSWVIRLS